MTVLERGQPVESRGRDIGALFARRKLNPDSNLCYGEGGAGTWSDGKLTTRIGRNGDDVRSVLKALVAFGAPEGILVSGKPHLGTDRLVRILRNAREYLLDNGCEIRFGATVDGIRFEDINDSASGRTKRVVGIDVTTNVGDDANTKETIVCSNVILASGHSARTLFEGTRSLSQIRRHRPFADWGARSYGCYYTRHIRTVLPLTLVTVQTDGR